MSTQVLFQRRPVATGIEGLTFDVVPTESHSRSWRVTDNMVEDGIAVSDHIDPAPATLSLQGIVTNAPLGLAGQSPEPGRAERWWQEVNALLAQQVTVTVVTGLEVYADMAVTGLSIDRDPKDHVKASMQLKQVRKADSRTVAIPAEIVGAVEAEGDPTGTVKAQATSEVDAGTMQTVDASDAVGALSDNAIQNTAA